MTGLSYKNVNGKQVQVGSDEDPDSGRPYRKPSEVSTADLGAAARARSKSASSSSSGPKMEAGESLGAFAARRRKYTEDQEKTAAQRKVLSK